MDNALYYPNRTLQGFGRAIVSVRSIIDVQTVSR